MLNIHKFTKFHASVTTDYISKESIQYIFVEMENLVVFLSYFAVTVATDAINFMHTIPRRLT